MLHHPGVPMTRCAFLFLIVACGAPPVASVGSSSGGAIGGSSSSGTSGTSAGSSAGSSSGGNCTPGQVTACLGIDNCPGQATCIGGQLYGACVCPTAGSTSGGGSSGGGSTGSASSTSSGASTSGGSISSVGSTSSGGATSGGSRGGASAGACRPPGSTSCSWSTDCCSTVCADNDAGVGECSCYAWDAVNQVEPTCSAAAQCCQGGCAFAFQGAPGMTCCTPSGPLPSPQATCCTQGACTEPDAGTTGTTGGGCLSSGTYCAFGSECCTGTCTPGTWPTGSYCL